MTQHNLFDLGSPDLPPFVRASETSRQAAEAVAGRTEGMRAAVLRFLRERGERGATDEEILDALALEPNTGRPRRVELVASKDVADSGRTRKTRSGRSATIWIAKEFAE